MRAKVKDLKFSKTEKRLQQSVLSQRERILSEMSQSIRKAIKAAPKPSAKSALELIPEIFLAPEPGVTTGFTGFTEPTYNHTRGDSKLTPCDVCAGLALMAAARVLENQPPHPSSVSSAVNHPEHYGGDTPHEHVKCMEAVGLDKDAMLYNCTKYIWRCGKKHSDLLEDLRKARWYLDRKIKKLEQEPGA